MLAARKSVAIIGAGVSGLAAAKAFAEKGHNISVYERSHDLGGVWEPSRSYPDVQTQSPKDLYRYTDMAMPDDYPEWPKGPQVHAYLADYTKAHSITDNIAFETSVRSMERRKDQKPGWTLTLKPEKGRAKRMDFDFVAVCSGQFNEPNLLRHPGQGAFEAAGGAVMHSSEYTDPAQIKGKDVVILGFSKSATDIAVNAVQVGAKSVTIVYREPVWRIPYFLGGLVNFKRILYIRKQEEMFRGWNMSQIGKMAQTIGKPLIWANWRALEALLSLQLKLGKTGLRPSSRIEDEVNCAVPIVTPGLFDMIADGRIAAIKGTFDSYGAGAVNLTTGEKVPCDAAILAVGWKLGVPFLPDEYQKKLIEPDGQYRLYRIIVNPDLPDMGFVGFNSSFATVLCAEMAANWLVRYADGQLARQPRDNEMQANIDQVLRWKRQERPPALVYGGLCVAPYHFRHFDELLDDMGARKRHRNFLAENFLPPDADAYREFLDSTPHYSVS